MRLRELFDNLKTDRKILLDRDGINPDLVRLEYDSRQILRGNSGDNDGGVIYSCVRGDTVDGHDFAASAVRNGAAALLCECELPIEVPQIIVPGTRAVMGEAAAVLYGNPADKMKMVGVTGTNGKTTTTYVVRSIIRASGMKAGMIGTIIYDNGREETFAAHTTPEGPDIQLLLAQMVANGAGYCVMETSSHGLDQGRIEGCRYDAVGFSNLTPEHLEYHANMEKYFEAKRRLFACYSRGNWRGAANADDEYGRRLIDEFPTSVSAFSMKPDFPEDGAYKASIIKSGINGMRIGIKLADGTTFEVEAAIVGNYNAYNILEGIALTNALGFDIKAIQLGIASCPQIPGRLERYSFSNGVTSFVDYAHSSDAMRQALDTVRPLTKGKIRVLWGAGGDRTPLKRPVIGEMMARLADHVVVSTDNPRSEDPASIARDVVKGIKSCPRQVRSETILDREEAIHFILDAAEPGDVVLIAGKGPERYIDCGTFRIPFLDCNKVLEWAKNRSVEVLAK